jgi:hypothetical protein
VTPTAPYPTTGSGTLVTESSVVFCAASMSAFVRADRGAVEDGVRSYSETSGLTTSSGTVEVRADSRT